MNNSPAPGSSVHKMLAHHTDVVGEWRLVIGMHGQKTAAAEVAQPVEVMCACVHMSIRYCRAVWEVLPL